MAAKKKGGAKKRGAKRGAKKGGAKRGGAKKSAKRSSRKKAKRSGAKRTPNAAFMKPMQPSEQLSSVVGGSMMPRFIMPKFVLQLSSVAFNSWAMDGFLDVFWHYIPGESILLAISREVCIILAMAAAFLAVAFVSSRRWAVK